MSDKIIKQVVLKKGTSQAKASKIADQLGNKCMAVDKKDGQWRLVIAFDDAADFLAFQIAAGMIKMVPVPTAEYFKLAVTDVPTSSTQKNEIDST